MEAALESDLKAELSESSDGTVLLHDETNDGAVKGEWISLKPDDILTPQAVFELARAQGYRVDYQRLPVTDEQAPIPETFAKLEDRVIFALREHPDVVITFNWFAL